MRSVAVGRFRYRQMVDALRQQARHRSWCVHL